VESEAQDPAAKLRKYSRDDRIDVVCDAFEREWQTGTRPDLPSYLGYCPASERQILFTELVLLEWELRNTNHESPSWTDYLARFPEFADQIEAMRFKCVLRNENPADRPAGVRRIAHFELLEKLGSGAGGTVWKARDPRLQRMVAVKIPHASHLSTEDLGQLLRESRAAAQLRHPGIVGVHEAGREDGVAYIVADFVDGENLRTWLEHTSPPPEKAADLCRQMAEALHHAHTQGVIHRDLKPANVLLDGKDVAHIADFGLAKRISADSSLSTSSQVLGTPAYMSPEQARGENKLVDIRSDVYALGVILYEMLTKRRPFEGSFDEILCALMTKEPPRPRRVNRTIPRDLELICIKAMAKLPSDRYQSADALASDLTRFLNSTPIHARHYRTLELAWRAVRPRPLVAISVVTIIAAIVSVAWTWRAYRTNGASEPRLAKFATDPPGAQLVVVPISEYDGEPQTNHIIRTSGKSPIELKLMPGDYWVEALLADGRFQKAMRHIPKQGEWTSSPYPHLGWRDLEDGSISVPPVRIPEKSIIDGMIPVVESSDLPIEGSHSNKSVIVLYVDAEIVTFADYQSKRGQMPIYPGDTVVHPAQAVPLTFDDAVAYAEVAGKWLPTNTEWEKTQSRFPPRSPAQLAEWTLTPVLTNSGQQRIHGGVYGDHRITRGGSRKLINRDDAISESDYSSSNLVAIERTRYYPGVGARCIRTATPQFFSLPNSGDVFPK
jgi:serine/threonine protein kinase